MNTATGNVYSQEMSESRHEYYSLNEKKGFLSAEELTASIGGCVLNDRLSQKRIYDSFYNYAMTICNHYTNNYDNSVEVLNDGFLKVFREINRFKPSYTDIMGSFKGWMRKIMIYTAIDHFRKNQKYRLTKELNEEVIQVPADSEDTFDKISYDEILRAIQKLTPGYRVIFNLFVIEGFSHEEIASRLGISIGSSKSSLARGRRQMQKILFQQKQISTSSKINRSRSSLGTMSEYA